MCTYDIPIDVNLSSAYSYNDYGRDYYQLTFQTTSVPFGELPQVISELSLYSESPLALDTDQFPAAPPTDLSPYQRYFN